MQYVREIAQHPEQELFSFLSMTFRKHLCPMQFWYRRVVPGRARALMYCCGQCKSQPRKIRMSGAKLPQCWQDWQCDCFLLHTKRSAEESILHTFQLLSDR